MSVWPLVYTFFLQYTNKRSKPECLSACLLLYEILLMADQMFNFSHRYGQKETVSLWMHVIHIGQQMSPEGCVPCVCRPSWTRIYFSHFNIYVIVLECTTQNWPFLYQFQKDRNLFFRFLFTAAAVYYPRYHLNTTWNKMHEVSFTDTFDQRLSFAECFRTLVTFCFCQKLNPNKRLNIKS